MSAEKYEFNRLMRPICASHSRLRLSARHTVANRNNILKNNPI